MDKSWINNLNTINKEETKDPKLKEIENNLHNLSLGSSSFGNDYYYNNNNNKNFIQINENMGFNNINLNNFHNNNNINLNISKNKNMKKKKKKKKKKKRFNIQCDGDIENGVVKKKKKKNMKNKGLNNNNSFNNNQLKNDLFDSQSEIIINENNSNSTSHIINQNCYQINIEKLNIHNQINNINQNYSINPNDNNISKRSIKINESNKDKDSNNSNKLNQSMNLNYLLNNIEKLTENQSGCRLLQNKLQQSPSLANTFYQSLKAKINLKKLSIDSFGNYLIQKLLEYISNDLVQDFFNNVIYHSFMEIALNSHGSRVIQKLLGRIYMSPDIMTIFDKCLEGSMLDIFLNQCSTYIIISYISYIKYPNNQNIYNFIVQNIYFIATHKHSCCTLQKCLEEGNNIQRKNILMALAYISNSLFADQFGNYAIQFALSLKDESANQIIISQYLNNFQQNISNKISSNVYEKVLEFSDFQTKQHIIKSLCNFETVKNLLYNSYGNYVLQKTILAANEPYRSMYIQFIAPLIDGLKNLPNGYIIIHKIVNQFPELQGFSQFNSNRNKNHIYNSINNNLNNNNINNNFKGNNKKMLNDQRNTNNGNY